MRTILFSRSADVAGSLLTVMLVLASLPVSALEVGMLEVRSSLGDPLQATIKLDQAGELTADQLKVRQADETGFLELGMDRTGMDTFVRYEVFLDGQGKGAVFVTTDRPVSEPYIHLLTEFVWPGGRIVRDFPVLLDP